MRRFHPAKANRGVDLAPKQMHFAPRNLTEVTDILAKAQAEGRKIESLDLHALNAVLEHKAEDMTATVQAGITLQNFQQQ